jgi:hypothetical protein
MLPFQKRKQTKTPAEREADLLIELIQQFGARCAHWTVRMSKTQAIASHSCLLLCQMGSRSRQQGQPGAVCPPAGCQGAGAAC